MAVHTDPQRNPPNYTATINKSRTSRERSPVTKDKEVAEVTSDLMTLCNAGWRRGQPAPRTWRRPGGLFHTGLDTTQHAELIKDISFYDNPEVDALMCSGFFRGVGHDAFRVAVKLLRPSQMSSAAAPRAPQRFQGLRKKKEKLFFPYVPEEGVREALIPPVVHGACARCIKHNAQRGELADERDGPDVVTSPNPRSKRRCP